MASVSTGKSVTNSGNYILMEQVVNNVVVYNHAYNAAYLQYLKDNAQYKADYAEYLVAKEEYESGFADLIADEDGGAEEPQEPIPPTPVEEFTLPLEGLRIFDVTVQESSKLTQSPLETGVYVNDFKVRMPRKVIMKGICDNLREEMQVKDDRFNLADTQVGKYIDKIPIAGGAITSITNGIVNEVAGYDYETTQRILSTARGVYKKIHDMYTNTNQIDGGETGLTLPETWTIATKGAIYTNMILENVEQLNDAEHLMVIPVTLTFVELIMPGLNRDVLFPANDQDADLEMSGHQKKGSWKDRADTFFSDVGDFFS